MIDLSGIPVVLVGVIGASVAVDLVGIVLFRLQKNLPYMNILIITSILIGSVLLQMVGSTIHVIQVLDLPCWLRSWFGVCATWEGLGFQIAAVVFVVGSYYLAEVIRLHKVYSHKRQVSVLETAETGKSDI